MVKLRIIGSSNFDDKALFLNKLNEVITAEGMPS